MPQLTREQRGAVLAAALHEPRGTAATLLERLPPTWRACADAARALDALPAPARAARLADEARDLLAPLPAGLAAIHPTWLDRALAHVSPGVAAPVRDGRGAPPTVHALRRQLLGHLCSMPDRRQGYPCDAALAAPSALLDLLARLGWGLLTAAAAALDPLERARLLARLGPPPLCPVRLMLAPRVCQAELAHLARDGEPIVLRAGARRLAPVLAPLGDTIRQVAQRLPFDVGSLLLLYRASPPLPDTATLDLLRDLR
jgi:hypothetical protein